MKKLSLWLFILLSLFTTKSYSDDSSLYEFKWLDEGETVYVIQNKEHVKANSLGIDFSFIDSNSSPYQDSSGFLAAFTYYFSERWSMDFTFKQYNNADSDDLTNLLSADTNQVKPLVRRIDGAKIIHLNWIPFYGKINTFNKIFFFDWGLGAGFGQFNYSVNNETFLKKTIKFNLVEQTDTGFNFRSFLKFYTRSSMTMGFEYNLSGVNTIKSADGAKEILFYNDIMGTIGYIF
jgi:hypothetical protein